MSGRDMGGSERVEGVTYFTDEEYRILLSALTKERKLCKEVDERFKHGVPLVPIIDSIERKLNAIQYKRDKKLFKAKRIDNGEWVEGFLFLVSYDGCPVWCIGNSPLSANDYSEIIGENTDWFLIDEETIIRETVDSWEGQDGG